MCVYTICVDSKCLLSKGGAGLTGLKTPVLWRHCGIKAPCVLALACFPKLLI